MEDVYDVGDRSCWMAPPHNRAALRNMDELFPTRRVAALGKQLALMQGAGLSGPDCYTTESEKLRRVEFSARVLSSALIVIHGTTIREERYDHGADKASLFACFSITKSVVALLVATLIDDGRIASIDLPASVWLPELGDSAYAKASVRDLLTMRSGSRYDENTDGPEYARVASSGDGGMYEFARSFDSEVLPGTCFRYSSLDTEILGALVARITGMPIARYLSQTLWSSIGAEGDARWMLDAPGSPGRELAGGGLQARLRDVGRLGIMMARGGGHALPRSLINTMICPDDPTLAPGKLELGYGYGWQWWLQSEGGIAARGMFGQRLLIDPELQLVMVTMSAWPSDADEKREREVLAYFDAWRAHIRATG